jgi:hypothetical protein
MNLYKIVVEHFSQKDSEKAIKCFLIAGSSAQVYFYVDVNFNYGCWEDRTDDGGTSEIMDSEYNVIAVETIREKMIRLGGEYFDEDYEPEDLYYGVSVYGWELVQEDITVSEYSALVNLKIVEPIK